MGKCLLRRSWTALGPHSCLSGISLWGSWLNGTEGPGDESLAGRTGGLPPAAKTCRKHIHLHIKYPTGWMTNKCMLGIKGKLALDNSTPQGFSGDDSVLNPKDVSGMSACAFNIPHSKSCDSQAGRPGVLACSSTWQGRTAVLWGVLILGFMS